MITLIGDTPQVLERGEPYVELGALANDENDGDISNLIVIDSSQVDTSKVGTYIVYYRVVDSSGLSDDSERDVSVVDNSPPAPPKRLKWYERIIAWIKRHVFFWS
jgi:hypothetical protein